MNILRKEPVEFQYAECCFVLVFVQDRQQGFVGLELHRKSDGRFRKVATMIYWDACGQFFIETFGVDLPMGVVERMHNEAKELVAE